MIYLRSNVAHDLKF